MWQLRNNSERKSFSNWNYDIRYNCSNAVSIVRIAIQHALRFPMEHAKVAEMKQKQNNIEMEAGNPNIDIG